MDFFWPGDASNGMYISGIYYIILYGGRLGMLNKCHSCTGKGQIKDAMWGIGMLIGV